MSQNCPREDVPPEAERDRVTLSRRGALLWRRRALLLITALAAVLIFLGLDEHLFWGDEAITAIYSRNTLKFGLPYAFDGRNLCLYGTGTSVRSDLLATAYPWLQFYVTAASFALFGATTFAGRLPFALIGVVVVPLTYLLARRYSQERGSALLAALLLGCSPQYLLFMRQCRYFALVVLFSTLVLLLYPDVRWERRRSWLALAAVGILLFHSHFLAFGIFFLSLALAFAIFDRHRRRALAFAVAALIVAAGTLPWLWLLPSHGGKADHSSGLGHGLREAGILFWWYIRDMNRACIFQVILWAILPLAVIDRWRRIKRYDPEARLANVIAAQSELFLLTLAMSNLLLLSFFSPQPLRKATEDGLVEWRTRDADLRFMVGLMPVLAVLAGSGLYAVWRRNRPLGAILTALLIFTNLGTFTAPRSYLYEYIREFTRGYETSTESVCRALREGAAQDDLIFVQPAYQRDPLIFYLGDRLLFCAILSPDDERILPYQKDRLPGYIYMEEIAPRWIVTFRPQDKRGLPARMREHIEQNRVEYQTGVLDVYWRDTSRPEIIWHRFSAVKPADPADRVYIYRRKSPAPR